MLTEGEIKNDYILLAAKSMIVAARTAPKARGVDNLVMRICEKEDIEKISKRLEDDYSLTGGKEEFLLRDSRTVLNASYILLFATPNKSIGLNCGYCGFESCALKNKVNNNIPCFFAAEDLGLAIGSACSRASAMKVDTRVMFSAGFAALHLGMMPECHHCLAICISATSKNPFFDRK